MTKIKKDQYDIIDLDHDKLWNQKRTLLPLKEVIGLDTETIKGSSILICDSNKKTLLNGNFNDHIKFLTSKKYEDTINVFYNLDYDFRAIFKLLPSDLFTFLINHGELKIDYYNKELLIRYREGKNLTLILLQEGIKKKHEFQFWDTAQFKQFKKLDDVGKKLGIKKIDLKKSYGIDVSRLSQRKIKYDKEYRNNLIKYCIRDCNIAKKSHEEYYHALHKMGITTDKFYSGATAGRNLLQTKINPPLRQFGKILTLDDTGKKPLIKSNKKYIKYPYPDGLNSWGFWAYFGGRFETYLKGFFDNIYEYDINSAYPFIIKDLLSLDGPIIDIKNEKEYNPICIHAVIHCDLNISNCKISPYLRQIKGKTYYPTGIIKDCYLIKDEYEYFKHKGYIDKFHNAKLMLPHPEGDYKPFEYIQELYDQRRIYKDKNNPQYNDSMQQALKIVLNSIYGIMININVGEILDWNSLFNNDIEQDLEFILVGNKGAIITKTYKAGNVFMPIWAAEITARVRLMLIKLVEYQEDKVISFATDGIKTLEKLDNVNIDPLTLGAWDFINYGKGFVVGNGIYYLSDSNTIKKKDRKPLNKFRGFDSKRDIFKLIKDNSNNQELNINKEGPLKAKTCTSERIISIIKDGKIIRKKLSPEDTNIFTNTIKKLSCKNTDDNRVWYDEFNNFGEILTKVIKSRPYTIKELEDKLNL